MNIFNSYNNNIAYIKTQNCQIIATIAYRILKSKPMIKKPIVANHALFIAILNLWQNQFLSLYQFYRNTAFIGSIYQKLIFISFKGFSPR